MITEIQSFLRKILRLFLPAKFEVSTLTFSSFLYTQKKIYCFWFRKTIFCFLYILFKMWIKEAYIGIILINFKLIIFVLGFSVKGTSGFMQQRQWKKQRWNLPNCTRAVHLNFRSRSTFPVPFCLYLSDIG